MSCYTKLSGYFHATVSEDAIDRIEKFMREHVYDHAFSDQNGRPDYNRLVSGYCYREAITYPDEKSLLVDAVKAVADGIVDSARWPHHIPSSMVVEHVLEWLEYGECPQRPEIEKIELRLDVESTAIIADVTTLLGTCQVEVVSGREKVDEFFRQLAANWYLHSNGGFKHSLGSCELVGGFERYHVLYDSYDSEEFVVRCVFPDGSEWKYYSPSYTLHSCAC